MPSMDPTPDELNHPATESQETVTEDPDMQRPDVDLRRPSNLTEFQPPTMAISNSPAVSPPPLPAKSSRLNTHPTPGAPLFMSQEPGRFSTSPERRPLSMGSLEKSPIDERPEREQLLPSRPYSVRVNAPPRTGSAGLYGPNGTRNLDWVIPETQRGAHTVAGRMQPTLNYAKTELEKYQKRAQLSGWALNIAIGLQILVGALITGLSALVTGRNIQVTTSILGGASTVIASYLARVRGSNEPELSIQRVKDLSQFLRECDAFVKDHGDEIGNGFDERVNELRRRLEELLGNVNPAEE